MEKFQRDLSESQAALYEEGQSRTKLQMELDAKDSEIELLQQKLNVVNLDSASVHSGSMEDGDNSKHNSSLSSPGMYDIYAPLQRKGGVLFCTCWSVRQSVGLSGGPSFGLSTRWFPDDNSRTLRPRIMKLHRYIDHDWQMTPIDFKVTRSKDKVTVTRNSKMVSG
ncbi:hypothetical protein DPMN_085420 [Dreissena polymorpha]|uniref:Uncharacterized protein n=1 Tax=Dreissena polymorpha TaxID=45954 RepID=A0A9D3YCP3_DREPO|nr:hypothetical protein DPMN_085420 [Dreissena polymorpha]